MVVSASQGSGTLQFTSVHKDYVGSLFPGSDGCSATGGTGTENENIGFDCSGTAINLRYHTLSTSCKSLAAILVGIGARHPWFLLVEEDLFQLAHRGRIEPGHAHGRTRQRFAGGRLEIELHLLYLGEKFFVLHRLRKGLAHYFYALRRYPGRADKRHGVVVRLLDYHIDHPFLLFCFGQVNHSGNIRKLLERFGDTLEDNDCAALFDLPFTVRFNIIPGPVAAREFAAVHCHEDVCYPLVAAHHVRGKAKDAFHHTVKVVRPDAWRDAPYFDGGGRGSPLFSRDNAAPPVKKEDRVFLRGRTDVHELLGVEIVAGLAEHLAQKEAAGDMADGETVRFRCLVEIVYLDEAPGAGYIFHDYRGIARNMLADVAPNEPGP